MALFDFNFYAEHYGSGESSFIEKSFPTILGIFIGFGVNRLYEYLKEKSEIRKAGEEFVNELELYRETLQKQIETLAVAVDNLNKPENIPLSINSYIRSDEERINSINRLFVYKYFKKKLKNNIKESRRKVNKLYNVIKITEIEANNMKTYYDTYLSNAKIEYNKFLEAVNGMISGYSQILIDIEKDGGNPNNDPFVAEMNPIFSKLIENEDKNLYEINELICVPLANVTSKYRVDPRKNLITDHLKVCFRSAKESKALKVYFGFQLNQIKETFEKLIIDLNQNLDASAI